MIAKRTVLVLGAGASNVYGFPLGRGLRDLVCALPGHPNSIAAIVEAGHSLDEFLDFVRTLRHYGVASVDWFLEEHPDLIPIGKAAIAACLIPFENHGKLFPPGAPDNHWYELLLTNLLDPGGGFDATQLSIVTFNYDRSLEHYLYSVLATRLKSEDKARKALDGLPLVHVHGALGALRALDPSGRDYSPDLTGEAVAKARDEILVVGEAKDSSAAFERAAGLLNHAERIVFLGFGFHPASVKRLQLFNAPWDDDRRARVEVVATARKLPAHAWRKIHTEILGGALRSSTQQTQRVYDFLNATCPLHL